MAGITAVTSHDTVSPNATLSTCSLVCSYSSSLNTKLYRPSRFGSFAYTTTLTNRMAGFKAREREPSNRRLCVRAIRVVPCTCIRKPWVKKA